MTSPPEQLLLALQLGDSAFPIGAFALSHGLETAVEDGLVRDLAGAERYLASLLAGGLAELDLVALLAAHRHADDPAAVAAWDRALLARKLVREPREASCRAGRALLRAAEAITAGHDEADRVRAYGELTATGAAPGLHAVVHGLVAASLGLGAEPAALVFGHAFLLGGLSAAVRLLPIDHLAPQAALARLRPGLVRAVARAADRAARDDPDELGGFAPAAELLAMRHERGAARAFAT
jgi:urease accessory protein